MPARKKNITFDEYKSVKDEIIEISEKRFEVLLNKKFELFETKILNLMESKLNPKFEAIDSKFESLEKQMGFIKWFLPAFIGIMMIILKFVKV